MRSSLSWDCPTHHLMNRLSRVRLHGLWFSAQVLSTKYLLGTKYLSGVGWRTQCYVSVSTLPFPLSHSFTTLDCCFCLAVIFASTAATDAAADDDGLESGLRVLGFGFGPTPILLCAVKITAPAAGQPQPGRPLLAIISRLTQQKGLPLMLHGLELALSRGAQAVVLGSATEPDAAAAFGALAQRVAGGGDARVVLRYDEGLARRIYAAADLLLVPSFFEPCGLSQLIALRYGTIPVVAATGGLADTVRCVI